MKKTSLLVLITSFISVTASHAMTGEQAAASAETRFDGTQQAIAAPYDPIPVLDENIRTIDGDISAYKLLIGQTENRIKALEAMRDERLAAARRGAREAKEEAALQERLRANDKRLRADKAESLLAQAKRHDKSTTENNGAALAFGGMGVIGLLVAGAAYLMSFGALAVPLAFAAVSGGLGYVSYAQAQSHSDQADKMRREASKLKG
ncbi:MAG: hypothetical protein AABZ44_01830 [Elusimicrobiota bacterium]